MSQMDGGKYMKPLLFLNNLFFSILTLFGVDLHQQAFSHDFGAGTIFTDYFAGMRSFVLWKFVIELNYFRCLTEFVHKLHKL
jgi:hypothetical protein